MPGEGGRDVDAAPGGGAPILCPGRRRVVEPEVLART